MRGLVHVAKLVEHRQAAGNLDNSGQRFAVRHLREQLAELSGDVDRYVAELARNLTHADQYRTIATALRRASRTPEAIAWARRGLAEKGSWRTPNGFVICSSTCSSASVTARPHWPSGAPSSNGGRPTRRTGI